MDGTGWRRGARARARPKMEKQSWYRRPSLPPSLPRSRLLQRGLPPAFDIRRPPLVSLKLQQSPAHDHQGTSNQLELLEKMNIIVAEEYNGFGGLASALRIFVGQLKVKNSSFEEYVEQIDAIDRLVTEFETVISMLK